MASQTAYRLSATPRSLSALSGYKLFEDSPNQSLIGGSYFLSFALEESNRLFVERNRAIFSLGVFKDNIFRARQESLVYNLQVFNIR